MDGMVYTFRYTETSAVTGQPILCERKLRANGVENALNAFKRDFLEWGEPLPPKWEIFDIRGE